MLEGLDDIDWAALQHAYGSARDTPRWIRELASTDPGIRAGAQNNFDAAVLHQGFVYEATPPAIPFLLELLSDPETPDRLEIVKLVAIAANSIVSGRKDPDLLAKNAPPEFQIFDRIEEELTSALPTLGTLAGPGEADEEVRLWVLVILRTLGPRAAPAVRLLPSFREEPDERLRLALLYLAHAAGLTDLSLVRACLEEDGSLVVRWTAALVELRTEKLGTSERAIGELVAALEPGCDTLNWKTLSPLVEQPLTMVTVAATEAGPKVVAQLLPGLLRRAGTDSTAEPEESPGSDERTRLLQLALVEPDFFTALLTCTFGSQPTALTEPLSEMQRKVLYRVARAAWRGGQVIYPGTSEAFQLLQTSGFPTERARLQAMLGPDLPLPRRWPGPPRAGAFRRGARRAWIWPLLIWLVQIVGLGAAVFAMLCGRA